MNKYMFRKYEVQEKGSPSLPISRRAFLMSSAVMGALASLNISSFIQPAMAADNTQADFFRLSTFVTGHDSLDAVSAQRFFTALIKHDAAFGSKAAALLHLIDDQKFTHMDAFLAASKSNVEMMTTATSIVSAWYLGIVGAAADAELITYESSLMYAPTKGILAVPTYGPGPLAWGETPVGAGGATGANVPAQG